MTNNAVATEVEAIHSRYRKLLRFSESGSERVYELLRFAATSISPQFLFETIARIDDETSDFHDFRSLVDDLHPVYSRKLVELIEAAGESLLFLSQNSQRLLLSSGVLRRLRFKVICDLDNTAIENYVISAPAAFSTEAAPHGEIVPHFVEVMNFITGGGRYGSVTFVSARPKFLEKHSIKKTAEKLRAAGLSGFSFEPGSARGPLQYIGYQLTGSTKFFEASAVSMADKKLECINSVKRVIPNSGDHRFSIIFFGDDTQGDVIVAEELAKLGRQSLLSRDKNATPASRNNISFIRRVVVGGGAVPQKRREGVHFFSSYREVVPILVREYPELRYY